MKSINDITDEEIFIELLDNPFTNISEKGYIDSTVISFQGPRKKISPDQRQALKAIIIRVRRRMKASNTPLSWLKFLPVENFRPKKDVCPKCKGKLVNWVGRISGNRYKHLLVCENSLKHELHTNHATGTQYYMALCNYVEEKI